MYVKSAVVRARAVLAAAVVCASFTGNVPAAEHPVVVSMHVTRQGLDLRQPQDVREFYTRLRFAARVVCTHGNRVDLKPLDDPRSCFEEALGNAVRVARIPLLTQLYLANHTLGDAVTHGIEMPAQVARK